MTAIKECANLLQVIAQMKSEVLYDMAIGRVPEAVNSFSELHDYVDANCYGGFCIDGGIMDTLIEQFGGRDADEGMPDGALKFMNDAQDAIHKWLQEFSSKGPRVITETEEYIYVQTQTLAGNWVNRTGVKSVARALEHKQWEIENGAKARVVIKTIAVIG